MPADNGTVLGFGTAIRAENQILIVEKNSTSSVHPGITSSINLGTSTHAWAQIYGNGIHANVDGVNNAGGLSLCGTAPATYGIAMRAGAAHGWIMAQQSNANIARAYGISTSDTTGTDWGINFYNSGSKLRGWKFMFGTTTVASINGYGFMSVNRISLNRSSAEADLTNGRIYWGSAARYDWVDYVSNNAEGAAPTGGKPSSLGNVTNWARRFSFENASGYGWIWETTANAVATAATTPLTPRMALSSYTGRLQLAPNASSTNVKSSGIVISSAENGSNGNVAIELWKGTGTSWQIAAETDTFYLRNNKPRDAAAIDTTSYSTDCFSITNEGDSWFPGEMKIGYKGQQYFRLYAATRGTTSTQGIARIDVGSATANDVAENSRGQVRLYHTNTSYADLQSNGWISDGVLEIFNFQGATSNTANIAAYTTVAIGNAQNVSAANNAHSEGRIYLYSAATNAHIIKGASTTTDYTHYFPNQSGWIAIGGNGSSTGVGSAGLPVYLSTAGVITVCTAGDITTTVDNQRKFVRLAGDTMTGALTVPSIFTVQAQNTTTEGGDICLKKATNGTNDAHLDVYNNLFRIHNDTVARFTIDLAAGGDATFADGLVKITKNSNTVTIGSANASYCHFSNSANIPFYFNKVIYGDGGFTIYNTGDNHWRNGYLKINKTDGGDCYLELRRNTNADWRIINSGGNLYLQNNWTTGKGSYFNVLQLDYNTGHVTVSKGDLKINQNLRLYRNSGVGVGRIHFYSTYKTWSIYMSNPVASACPSGGTPSTLGDVTAWALRSYIENSSGYGWIWESAAESNTGTPTARMALNANNGQLTVAGGINTNGDLNLYTSSADSPDITWWYANKGKEQARIWMGSGGASKWAPLYRCYASDGTSLYSGNLVLGDGTGASGTWGINITGRAYSLKDRTNDNTSYLNYGAEGLAASAITWLCCWNGYEVRAISKAEMANATDSAHKWVRIGGDTMTGVLTTTYKSGTWVNSLTSSAITLSDTTGSYGGWICGPTKNGRIAISTYQNSDDLLYIGYGERGRTTNSFTRSMTWNGANGRLTTASVANAIWNDYAECRIADTIEPGYCVTETQSGKMTKTNKRLMPGCKLISDTYGVIMGETSLAQTPIAVAGRVLAYTYQNRNNYPLGAAVCSAPDGTIDIMTRDEIMMYPERIIGIVSEIPDYEVWEAGENGEKKIPVNGRIWIYVK